jgi:phosphoserine phosphatase
MSQLLLKVSGADAPGITATIMRCLSEKDARILDLEQAVTHDLLSLLVLTELPGDLSDTIKSELSSALQKYHLDLSFVPITGTTELADPEHRFVATVIAQEIPTKFLADVTATLADSSINIDGLRKLSSGGLSTIEITASSPTRISLPTIKEKLLGIAKNFPTVDLAVQKENLYRRSKRLVVFDMDSTLTEGEIIDELAALVGKREEVSALTKKAMEGEMDFQESLLRRVSLLKGLQKSDLDKVYAGIKLTNGAETLIKVLKRLGFKIAIISGGFTYFVDRLKQDLGVHYSYANVLDFDGEELSGRLQGLIVDGRRKADLLDLLAQQEGVMLDQVIAIGDGANDLQMLKKAGLGIAFNAKPMTKAMVGTSITQKRMDSILYFLGITDRDIAEMGIR